MDLNSFISNNEFGVVALPYVVNGSALHQERATVGCLAAGTRQGEEAQWPQDNNSILLTLSTINGAQMDKNQEGENSLTFLPYLPSMFLTEDGALLSAPVEGSPHTLTLIGPSTLADSTQTVIDIEQTALPCTETVLASILEPTSMDSSPISLMEDETVVSSETYEKKSKIMKEYDLDDMALVVTVFKCKACSFHSEERDELTSHILKAHSGGTFKSTRRRNDKQILSNDRSSFSKNGVEHQQLLNENQIDDNDSELRDEDDYPTNVFFSCGSCLKVCTSMNALRQHMEKIHGILKEVKEEECDLRDDVYETPEIHSNVSSLQVANESDMNEYITKCEKEEELKLTTREGSESVTSNFQIERKDLKFQCALCSVKFSSKTNLETHRKCHNQADSGSRFKCLICGQHYNRWLFCSGHLWLAHKVAIDLYSCPICDYKTAHRDKFVSHEKMHRDLKEYCCRYCSKQFNQKTQLRNHEVLHMKKMSDPKLPEWAKPKECDHCHKTFCDSKALKKHIKTVHSKLKPYVCQVCGHCSARKGMFQLHIRQHTGDKPFSCLACDFSTRDHNSLRRHVMRHTGVRQYQCKLCSYSAIQSHLFKVHLIKNHGGEGVFACNTCSFTTLNEQAFFYHRHEEQEGVEKLEEENPTLIYVPFNEKDNSNKNAESGELIAINIRADDEESSNYFDPDTMIDTGGITIAEDVSDNKRETSTSKIIKSLDGIDDVIVMNSRGNRVDESPTATNTHLIDL